jgi:site-specific recombinase XerD
MKYKKNKDKNFWIFARKFLHEYMPAIRGLSNKSVAAYKQSLKSYLHFLEEQKAITNESVCFDYFSKNLVVEFIAWLKENNYSSKSINLKLTAIRSFLKYCGGEDVELWGVYSDICTIRKMKEEKRPITYLLPNATSAILSAFDTDTAKHRRNRMLLILLYDSGARVQELSDLNKSSLHLEASNPFITLVGKGRKTRNVPILEKTKQHLLIYLKEFHPSGTEAPLFYSILDGKPHRLSTDSISLVLKSAADMARKTSADVPENVHCHLFRKTKAMDLYKNNVPLPFIMQLLGHESMSTTAGFYAFATLEMMSVAMEKAAPKVLTGSKAKLWSRPDVKKVLYSLD